MDLVTVLFAFVNALHVLAAIVWLGGIVFLVGVLFPFRSVDTTGLRSVFYSAVQQFKPYMYASIGVNVATGIWRIIQKGGMGGIPPVVHIKIALVLLMLVMSLMSYLYFLPKVEAAMKLSQKSRRAGDAPVEATPVNTKITTAADHALRGMVWCLGVAGVLGVAAVLVLAFGGKI